MDKLYPFLHCLLSKFNRPYSRLKTEMRLTLNSEQDILTEHELLAPVVQILMYQLPQQITAHRVVLRLLIARLKPDKYLH